MPAPYNENKIQSPCQTYRIWLLLTLGHWSPGYCSLATLSFSQFLDCLHLSYLMAFAHSVFSAWCVLPTFCLIHVYPQVLNFTFSRFALTSESLLNLSDIISNVSLSYSRSTHHVHTTLNFTPVAFIIICISIYVTLS